MDLITVGTNAKTIKSDESQNKYLTAILYLSPAKTSGYQTCPNSSKGCRASCLFTAGRGAFSNVQNARLRKTKLWFEDRKEFISLLSKDLIKFKNKCKKENRTPAIRLNGTSDIPFVKNKLVKQALDTVPDLQMYDYTKRQSYFREYMEGKLPSNLHLTFSKSEHNWKFCQEVLDNGFNISAVFDELPETYKGYNVFNGDNTDLRFLDPYGICGLKMKGRAKKDDTGFVIRQ